MRITLRMLWQGSCIRSECILLSLQFFKFFRYLYRNVVFKVKSSAMMKVVFKWKITAGKIAWLLKFWHQRMVQFQ